ncbi:MAG: hypothetical protein QXR42_00405 [Candidatus Bathyarchaeia archaeon]
MSRTRFNEHLEWIREAENAIEKGNFESAARFFRYVSTYYGMVNDEPNRKKFAVKTGESYLSAGEACLAQNELFKATTFYVKASSFFNEGGDEEKKKVCELKILQCQKNLTREGMETDIDDIRELKAIGDYFADKGELASSLAFYQTAADKARKQEKTALAAGLYRNIGDCFKALKDFEAAAERYATAGDLFLLCGNYFEAARHFCESGFFFIRVGKHQKASIVAAKASLACNTEGIDVILDDLSEVCKLLSQKSLDEAKERWSKIRIKFKRSYIELVDSCFESMTKQ